MSRDLLIRSLTSARPLRGRASTRLAWMLVAAVASVLVAVALAGPVVAAGAASPPTSTPAPAPVKETWALSPTGPDPSQPSTRPYLTYLLAKGATVHDSVTVWNYSDVQITFQVYANDAFNTPSGGFDLLAGNKRPSDVGRWVTLVANAVTIPARHSVAIPFTLTVPRDASPGDHTGGIVAALTTPTIDSKGNRALVTHRTGSRLYVRVSGPVHPTLAVEDVRPTYHGTVNPAGRGSVDVTYTVHNTGNIRLAGHQVVSVAGPFGLTRVQVHPKDLEQLLPGSTYTTTVTVPGVWPLGLIDASVKVTPYAVFGSVKPPPRATSASGSTFAPPWIQLMVVAIVGALWWRRRSRRRLAPPPPRVAASAPASTPGDGTGSEPAAVSR